MIAFMSIKQWIVSQDFRYSLPLLIPLVILFVHAMETFRTTQGWRFFYIAGTGIGLCLPLGGIVLYLSQHFTL